MSKNSFAPIRLRIEWRTKSFLFGVLSWAHQCWQSSGIERKNFHLHLLVISAKPNNNVDEMRLNDKSKLQSIWIQCLFLYDRSSWKFHYRTNNKKKQRLAHIPSFSVVYFNRMHRSHIAFFMHGSFNLLYFTWRCIFWINIFRTIKFEEWKRVSLFSHVLHSE